MANWMDMFSRSVEGLHGVSRNATMEKPYHNQRYPYSVFFFRIPSFEVEIK